MLLYFQMLYWFGLFPCYASMYVHLFVSGWCGCLLKDGGMHPTFVRFAWCWMILGGITWIVFGVTVEKDHHPCRDGCIAIGCVGLGVTAYVYSYLKCFGNHWGAPASQQQQDGINCYEARIRQTWQQRGKKPRKMNAEEQFQRRKKKRKRQERKRKRREQDEQNARQRKENDMLRLAKEQQTRRQRLHAHFYAATAASVWVHRHRMRKRQRDEHGRRIIKGARVVPLASGPPPRRESCDACGALLQAGPRQAFCGNCGARCDTVATLRAAHHHGGSSGNLVRRLLQEEEEAFSTSLARERAERERARALVRERSVRGRKRKGRRGRRAMVLSRKGARNGPDPYY